MSGAHRAALSSLTLYGAILGCSRRLRRREMLALRLPSGGRIQARVRWRLGARCGIRFLSPVADFARLLRESRRTQEPTMPLRLNGIASTIASDRANILDRMRDKLIRAQRLGRQILRWSRRL